MKFSLPILFLAATTLAGCDGFTSVTGRVTNPLGQPIEDAKVTLEIPPSTPQYHGEGVCRSVNTGKDGSFGLGMMDSPYGSPDKFSIVKDGYEPYNETVKSGTQQKDRTIVLVPKVKSSAEDVQQKQYR